MTSHLSVLRPQDSDFNGAARESRKVVNTDSGITASCIARGVEDRTVCPLATLDQDRNPRLPASHTSFMVVVRRP